MSGTSTVRMINAYFQEATPMSFLSGFFTSPPQNFHTSQDVEIDIVRSEEDIAIVVQDMSTGHRMNSTDLYTNKKFTPPVFQEAVALDSFNLIKRMPGETPFDSPDFRANLILQLFSGMRKIEGKIRRSMELQASQVLQNGTVSLTDSAGVTLYSIDYKPKATHFPTSGTTWNNSGTDDKIGDLKALADIIRGDGLMNVDELIFGDLAFEYFLNDAAVQNLLNNRRMELGGAAPEQRGNGQIYQGFIWLGNYKFSMWTYQNRYKHPQTGVSTKFITPGKVIVRSSGARMDATFGAIPNIGALLDMNTATNVLPDLPGRFSNNGSSIDLHPIAWLTPDGQQLLGGIGARPLMIPTAIDTYGCQDTGL